VHKPPMFYNQTPGVILCPVCSCADLEPFAAPHVYASKCLNRECGHLFAVNTIPGGGVMHLKDPTALYNTFKARNLDLVRFLTHRQVLFEGVRLLDVGAGSGHIVRVIHEIVPSARIACVEADAAAADHLRVSGYRVHPSLSTVSEQFDTILLIEVIEHIDEPVAFFEKVKSLLAPGGTVFVTTPCGERSNGSRVTHAYETPEHVQFFTETSLSLCIRRAGFSTFQCESMKVMVSKLTRAPLRYIKDICRPLRAALYGHVHLTGFAR
jgi:SAM-dependent methyltransferase